jgi:short-subunit dehydrogenase
MNSKSNGKSSRLGTAVVTGASSGLGKVCADRLAQRGYDLILVARRADRLQNVTEALQAKYSIEANVIVADLGNSADVQRVADTISADSRVSVLVNNAGTASLVPSVSISLTDLDARLNVNARAVSHLSRAVLPEFIKRDAGTIINIGSVLSF